MNACLLPLHLYLPCAPSLIVGNPLPDLVSALQCPLSSKATQQDKSSQQADGNDADVGEEYDEDDFLNVDIPGKIIQLQSTASKSGWFGFCWPVPTPKRISPTGGFLV